MSQKDTEVYEYEARAMIDNNTYQKLLDNYSDYKNVKKIVNVNTYFDTEDRFLTNNHIVLRLREIDDKEKELTLKIKGENGDIEITHPLTYDEYIDFFKKTIIPSSNVKTKLIELGLPLSSLKLIVTLKTNRLEVYKDKYTFVIDQNFYRGKEDFNVEVESDSKKRAKHYLNKEISKFGYKYKKGYISKSRRAIFDL